jgi:hypothetical protein
VSDRQPFSSVVGTDVVLVRPVYFCDQHEAGKAGYYLTETNQPQCERRLPAGTSLHVTCVKERRSLTPMVHAYGTGVDPTNGEPFTWCYYWGYPHEIWRAPWEDANSVPDARPIKLYE